MNNNKEFESKNDFFNKRLLDRNKEDKVINYKDRIISNFNLKEFKKS